MVGHKRNCQCEYCVYSRMYSGEDRIIKAKNKNRQLVFALFVLTFGSFILGFVIALICT